ncbi:hypothetical protein PCE1_001729 [Barthelona sp. PCE]
MPLDVNCIISNPTIDCGASYLNTPVQSASIRVENVGKKPCVVEWVRFASAQEEIVLFNDYVAKAIEAERAHNENVDVHSVLEDLPFKTVEQFSCYDQKIFALDPLSKPLYPTGRNDFQIVFTPEIQGTVVKKAYLKVMDFDGFEHQRLEVTLHGVGQGPDVRLEDIDVDLGSVYLNSEIEYIATLRNMGVLKARYQIAPLNTNILEMDVSLSPMEGIIESKSSQEVVIKILPKKFAPVSLSVYFQIQGVTELLKLHIKATVKCPKFDVSTPNIDLGNMSSGFLMKRSFLIENIGEIDFDYYYQIRDCQTGLLEKDITLTDENKELCLESGCLKTVTFSVLPTKVGTFERKIDIFLPQFSKKPMRTITIVGEARIAELILDQELIDFGKVYLKKSVKRSLTLINNSPIPLKFVSIPQAQATENAGFLNITPKSSIIKAESSVNVEVELFPLMRGDYNISLSLRSIGGTQDISDSSLVRDVLIRFDCYGPSVVVHNDSVNFGGCECLTEFTKYLNIENTSPIDAPVHLVLGNRTEAFYLESSEYIIAPLSVEKIPIHCFLRSFDLKKVNVLDILLENSDNKDCGSVKLTATGKGSTIIMTEINRVEVGDSVETVEVAELLRNSSLPADTIEVDYGDLLFNKIQGSDTIVRLYSIVNHGTDVMTLQWKVLPNSNGVKSQMFSMSPDRVRLEPNAFHIFSMSISTKQMGNFNANLQLQISNSDARRMANKKTFNFKFAASIIAPSLDCVPMASMDFCYDAVIKSLGFACLMQPFSLTNNTDIPLELELNTPKNFGLIKVTEDEYTEHKKLVDTFKHVDPADEEGIVTLLDSQNKNDVMVGPLKQAMITAENMFSTDIYASDNVKLESKETVYYYLLLFVSNYVDFTHSIKEKKSIILKCLNYSEISEIGVNIFFEFPNLSFSDVGINFGSLLNNTTKTDSLTISNTSNRVCDCMFSFGDSNVNEEDEQNIQPSDLFSVTPYSFVLGPGEEIDVQVVFTATKDLLVDHSLLLHTEGGPLYSLYLRGRCSFISYYVSQQFIDLGCCKFTTIPKDTFIIRNTGKCDYNFKFTLSDDEDVGLSGLFIEPSKGFIAAGDEVQITVHLMPKLPGLIKKKFLLILDFLPPISLIAQVYALVPSLVLSLDRIMLSESDNKFLKTFVANMHYQTINQVNSSEVFSRQISNLVSYILEKQEELLNRRPSAVSRLSNVDDSRFQKALEEDMNIFRKKFNFFVGMLKNCSVFCYLLEFGTVIPKSVNDQMFTLKNIDYYAFDLDFTPSRIELRKMGLNINPMKVQHIPTYSKTDLTTSIQTSDSRRGSLISSEGTLSPDCVDLTFTFAPDRVDDKYYFSRMNSWDRMDKYFLGIVPLNLTQHGPFLSIYVHAKVQMPHLCLSAHRLIFDDVYVGEMQTNFLKLYNPTDLDVTFTLTTKKLKTQFRIPGKKDVRESECPFEFPVVSQTIPSKTSFDLPIIFKPPCDGIFTVTTTFKVKDGEKTSIELQGIGATHDYSLNDDADEVDFGAIILEQLHEEAKADRQTKIEELSNVVSEKSEADLPPTKTPKKGKKGKTEREVETPKAEDHQQKPSLDDLMVAWEEQDNGNPWFSEREIVIRNNGSTPVELCCINIDKQYHEQYVKAKKPRRRRRSVSRTPRGSSLNLSGAPSSRAMSEISLTDIPLVGPLPDDDRLQRPWLRGNPPPLLENIGEDDYSEPVAVAMPSFDAAIMESHEEEEVGELAMTVDADGLAVPEQLVKRSIAFDVGDAKVKKSFDKSLNIVHLSVFDGQQSPWLYEVSGKYKVPMVTVDDLMNEAIGLLSDEVNEVYFKNMMLVQHLSDDLNTRLSALKHKLDVHNNDRKYKLLQNVYKFLKSPASFLKQFNLTRDTSFSVVRFFQESLHVNKGDTLAEFLYLALSQDKYRDGVIITSVLSDHINYEWKEELLSFSDDMTQEQRGKTMNGSPFFQVITTLFEVFSLLPKKKKILMTADFHKIDNVLQLLSKKIFAFTHYLSLLAPESITELESETEDEEGSEKDEESEEEERSSSFGFVDDTPRTRVKRSMSLTLHELDLSEEDIEILEFFKDLSELSEQEYDLLGLTQQHTYDENLRLRNRLVKEVKTYIRTFKEFSRVFKRKGGSNSMELAVSSTLKSTLYSRSIKALEDEVETLSIKASVKKAGKKVKKDLDAAEERLQQLRTEFEAVMADVGDKASSLGFFPGTPFLPSDLPFADSINIPLSELAFITRFFEFDTPKMLSNKLEELRPQEDGSVNSDELSNNANRVIGGLQLVTELGATARANTFFVINGIQGLICESLNSDINGFVSGSDLYWEDEETFQQHLKELLNDPSVINAMKEGATIVNDDDSNMLTLIDNLKTIVLDNLTGTGLNSSTSVPRLFVESDWKKIVNNVRSNEKGDYRLPHNDLFEPQFLVEDGDYKFTIMSQNPELTDDLRYEVEENNRRREEMLTEQAEQMQALKETTSKKKKKGQQPTIEVIKDEDIPELRELPEEFVSDLSRWELAPFGELRLKVRFTSRVKNEFNIVLHFVPTFLLPLDATLMKRVLTFKDNPVLKTTREILLQKVISESLYKRIVLKGVCDEPCIDTADRVLYSTRHQLDFDLKIPSSFDNVEQLSKVLDKFKDIRMGWIQNKHIHTPNFWFFGCQGLLSNVLVEPQFESLSDRFVYVDDERVFQKITLSNVGLFTSYIDISFENDGLGVILNPDVTSQPIEAEVVEVEPEPVKPKSKQGSRKKGKATGKTSATPEHKVQFNPDGATHLTLSKLNVAKQAVNPTFHLSSHNMVLAPGEKKTLQVYCYPQIPCLIRDKLIINVLNQPDNVTIPMYSLGSVPRLSLSTESLSFGKILTDKSVSLDLALKNTGYVDVAFDIDMEIPDYISFSQTSGVVKAQDEVIVKVKALSLEALEFALSGAINTYYDSFYFPEATTGLDPSLYKFRLESLPLVLDGEFYEILLSIGNVSACLSATSSTYSGEKDEDDLKTKIDFGTVRVYEEVTSSLVLRNSGKYDISYRLHVKETSPLKGCFVVDQPSGVLSAGKDQLASSVNTGKKGKKRPTSSGEQSGTSIDLSVVWKPKTTVDLVDSPDVMIEVFDLQRDERIGVLPVFVTCTSVFSRFILNPASGINFGPLEFNAKLTREFTITNTGVFPFSAEIVTEAMLEEYNNKYLMEPKVEAESGTVSTSRAPSSIGKTPRSAKPKKGAVVASQERKQVISDGSPLQLGPFTISPGVVNVEPNRTATFTVKFKPTKEDIGTSVTSDNSGSVWSISSFLRITDSDADVRSLIHLDTEGTTENIPLPHSLDFRGHGCEPLIDKSVTEIFEEYAVLHEFPQLATTIPNNIFSISDNCFSFGPCRLNSTHEVRLKISNPTKISEKVVFLFSNLTEETAQVKKEGKGKKQPKRPKSRPSSGVQKNNSGFFLKETQFVLSPHEYKYVTVYFEPSNLQTTRASLDVCCCSLQGETEPVPMLSIDFLGEGVLPLMHCTIPRENNITSLLRNDAVREELNKVIQPSAAAATAKGSKKEVGSADLESMLQNAIIFPELRVGKQHSLSLPLHNPGVLNTSLRVGLSPTAVSSMDGIDFVSILDGFAVSGGSVTIAPNETRDVLVTFSPSRSSTHMGCNVSKSYLIVDVPENSFDARCIPLIGISYSSPLTLSTAEDDDMASLSFVDVDIGVTTTRCVNLTNHSDDVYKFNVDITNFITSHLSSSKCDFNVVPAVGHILPGETIELHARLKAHEKLSVVEVPLNIGLQQIRYAEESDRDIQWNSDMTEVSFITYEDYQKLRSDYERELAEIEKQKRNRKKKGAAPIPKIVEVPPLPASYDPASGEPVRLQTNVAEPTIIVEQELAPLPIMFEASVDFVKYELGDDVSSLIEKYGKVAFKKTYMYQKRVFTFTIKNPSYSNLCYDFDFEYTKQVEHKPMCPYSVEPAKGVIPPQQSQKFSLVFAPLEVFDNGFDMTCSIVNLHEDCAPLRIPLDGVTLRPLCYFDVPESKYLFSSERDSSLALPDGTVVSTETAHDWSIVDFANRGVDIKSRGSIVIVNPTSYSYRFIVSCIDKNATIRSVRKHSVTNGVFTCLECNGKIEPGRQKHVEFEFVSSSLENQESCWMIEIPEFNLVQKFLLVGRTVEPQLYLNKPHLNFGDLLVGTSVTQQLELFNNEDIPFDFTVDNATLEDIDRNVIFNISPVSGVVPPHEKFYNLNASINVRRKTMKLSLNVKGQGYNLIGDCYLQTTQNGVVNYRELVVGKANIVDFGSCLLNQVAARTFKIQNSGLANFNVAIFPFKSNKNPSVVHIPESETVVRTKSSFETNLTLNTSEPVELDENPADYVIALGPGRERKYLIRFKGSVDRPKLEFSSRRIDFGKRFVLTPNSDVYSLPFEITNNDDIPLTIELQDEPVQWLTHDFSSTTLSPNETKSYKFNVKPIEVGAYKHSLQLSINSGIVFIPLTVGVNSMQPKLYVYNKKRRLTNTTCRVSFLGTSVSDVVTKTFTLVNRSELPIENLSLELEFGDIIDPSLPSMLSIYPTYPFTLGPKQLYDVTVTFKPNKRIGKFQVPIIANFCDTSISMGRVEGSSVGTAVKLESSNLNFPAVALGSSLTRRILLHNFGDLPTFFNFKVLNDKQLGIEHDFELNPMSGYLPAGEDLPLNVVFHPQKVQRMIDYELECEIEGSTLDPLHLELGGVCVQLDVPEENKVEFETAVRSGVTKTLTLNTSQLISLESNTARSTEPPAPTGKSRGKAPATTPAAAPRSGHATRYMLNPVFNGSSFFRGASSVEIIEGQNVSYDVVYSPLAMTSENDVHEATLFIALPDGNAFYYSLTGISGQPSAMEAVNVTTASREVCPITLEINNWLNDVQRFHVFIKGSDGVEKEISSFSSSMFKLNGAAFMDVPANSTKPFSLSFIAQKHQVCEFDVVFRVMETNEYLECNVKLNVEAPKPLGPYEVRTPLRSSIDKTLYISNPLSTPVSFTSQCDEDTIEVARKFLVPPNATHFPFDVKWVPTVPVTKQVQLRLSCEMLDTVVYTLDLETLSPLPERPLSFRAAIGTTMVLSAKLRNICTSNVTFNASITGHSTGFFSVDPTLTVNGSVQHIMVPVSFEPLGIGSFSATLILENENVGSYTIPLKGHATLPRPQGPILVGGATTINFKNIFDQQTMFNIHCDNPNFVVKNSEVVDAKKSVAIQVLHRGDSSKGRLTISHDDLEWVYFLNGE